MSQQNARPDKNFRCMNVRASIWKNEVEKDGQTVVRHSVQIRKRFRKDDGSYEDSDHFFPDELPRLALIAKAAYAYITLTESADEETPA